MNDLLNLSMFRAYDIRTPSERLTPDLADRLARAEAHYVREVLDAPGIVIGHDARGTGPRYLTITIDAFRAAGLDVIYLPGACSTSFLYYAAMRHPRHAAIMIGASHNPAGDTGQKLLAPSLAPIARAIGPAGGLDQIERFYREGASCPSAGKLGTLQAKELIHDYVDFSMDRAGVARGGLAGTRVLQDYLYGAAGREMMLAFDRAGADLTPLHFAADGSFPLGDPNPVKPRVVGPGLEALRAGDFLLGMFFDGDGDRLDVYGGDGLYLSSSFVYAAILPEIRRRFPGSGLGVFADLKCNPLAIIEMARAGVTVDVIRNGHSQIKESLRLDTDRFGAVEESAHFYEAFPLEGGRYCTENTLYLALLIARTWREHPARFARLCALQSSTAREREWGYKFPSDQARAEVLEAVQRQLEATGLQSMRSMKNGMDLEATLMRRGLPFDVDDQTKLAPDWLQVCQRISQSEDGLARWEVVGATTELVRQTKREIAESVSHFGAGTEYQG